MARSRVPAPARVLGLAVRPSRRPASRAPALPLSFSLWHCVPTCHPSPPSPSRSPARSPASLRWLAGDQCLDQQTDPTNTLYTTPRFHFATKHHGSSSGDSSPTTVAARRPRWPVTRWYNAVAIKARGQGASGAYHDHEEVIGWSWEALEAAGHGGGARRERRRPEVEDDGSSAIQAELG
jgi:hypothetical protein